MGQRSTTAYEERGEFGRLAIRRGRTGWVVEQHSRWQGTMTGRRVIVRYDNAGYGPTADLTRDHNQYTTAAQYIVHLAGAPEARVLRRGTLVR